MRPVGLGELGLGPGWLAGLGGGGRCLDVAGSAIAPGEREGAG